MRQWGPRERAGAVGRAAVLFSSPPPHPPAFSAEGAAQDSAGRELAGNERGGAGGGSWSPLWAAAAGGAEWLGPARGREAEQMKEDAGRFQKMFRNFRSRWRVVT
ncbi:hypothetical protein SRHO_G00169300 [Serrasalmus rhombeus]